MDQTTGPNENTLSTSEERAIRGAEAIAQHIFGDRASSRKVHYLAECSKLADLIRKHALLAAVRLQSWLESQEVAR
jgi:hypothetical protein